MTNLSAYAASKRPQGLTPSALVFLLLGVGIGLLYLIGGSGKSHIQPSWINLSPAVLYIGMSSVALTAVAVAAVSSRKASLRGAAVLSKTHTALLTSSEVLSPVISPRTRFSDVSGADEAVADCQEMVEFIRDSAKFSRMGAKVPQGALLVGPPGTGKTLLARAVAGEAGVPVFVANGSDFVQMYVGQGSARVRELYENARRAAPCIVFIDEIDAFARTRASSSSQGASAEHEHTLIALLAELDGFDRDGSASPVITLAATNRPDILDPALTRAGRLDRRVELPLPDRVGREKILHGHSQGKPIGVDVDLSDLASRTPGFSGSQLAMVVNEACLAAVRSEAGSVSAEHFHSAVARIAAGRPRTSAVVTDHDRSITAWHEAGHALAALLLPQAPDPVMVSIVPRGAAGGVTWMRGSDELFLTRQRARSELVVSLAGRVAEMHLLSGEFSQGAVSDLQKATDLAVRMVGSYGMTSLGLLFHGDPASDEGVRGKAEELLADAFHTASQLLKANAALLEMIALELLAHDELSFEQLCLLRTRSGAEFFELPPLSSVYSD